MVFYLPLGEDRNQSLTRFRPVYRAKAGEYSEFLAVHLSFWWIFFAFRKMKGQEMVADVLEGQVSKQGDLIARMILGGHLEIEVDVDLR